MIALYKDPQGKNIFKSLKVDVMANHTSKLRSYSASGISIDTAINCSIEGNGDNELTFLREKVAQLEEKLKQYEMERESKMDSNTGNVI